MKDISVLSVPRLIDSDEEEYFMDSVRGFESEFRRVFPDARIEMARHLPAKRFLVRLLRKGRGLIPRALLQRHVQASGPAFQMSVQMGPDFALVIPAFLMGGPNFIYMFDAWPRYMPWLGDFADLFQVRGIFFSARRSCELFNQGRAGLRRCGYWLPEGIAPDDYIGLPAHRKTIDVLEFGRRNETYHEQIRTGLERAGARHVYSTSSAPLFASKRELCQALSWTKICICFPSSVTHPARAEGVSTLTLRYLEAMISRCLVVGAAPEDIVEAFGYDPIIPVDSGDPAGQLVELVAHLDTHHELIERNYRAVTEHHLWRHRLESIRPFLSGDVTPA